MHILARFPKDLGHRATSGARLGTKRGPATVFSDRGRAQRWLALIASVSILALPFRDLLAAAQGAPTAAPSGVDFVLYRDAAARWLSGGGFYNSWQVTGHYTIVAGTQPILYPPVVLLLLVPFTVLPGFLWWAIPAVTIAWAIRWLRPSPLSWPLMAFCLAWPTTIGLTVHGNPVIWVVAFLSVGCVTAGPAALVLLKPSLFPFALVGTRSGRWWIALGALATLSVPFGAMWLDWIRALLNSDGSLVYSLPEYPMVTLPLVAWVARTRVASSAGSTPGQSTPASSSKRWTRPARG
jgi:hypothetical protein